jgi:hypothetical protein
LGGIVGKVIKSISFCDEELFNTLREMKGRYTWAKFLRLLVMNYYISKGEFLAMPPHNVFESWKNISKRLPLRVTRITRVHYSLLCDSYREWVKKYAGFEVYSVQGIRGYDSITLWIVRSGNTLTLINIKTNFLNPPSREEYIDLLIETLREALRKLCVERGVCGKIQLDPEMPLDREVVDTLIVFLNQMIGCGKIN